MKLYDIPKGSKIKAWGQVIIFDHLDGAYSYCYLESDEKKLIHLSGSTPLKQVGDYYVIIAQ